MKFSQLPVEVKNAVNTELKSVKIDFINQQCRYFANYGYKSAQEYRAFLINTTFTVDTATMINVIKSVLIDLLKNGKDFFHILPAGIVYEIKQNLMLSQAEIARKVQ